MTNAVQIITQCVNDDLLKLRALFQAEGFDVRIVGGAVRDILCGETPKDIDLCTNAFPDEAIAIYEKAGIRFEPTGIEHGTISVIMNGEVYEITSLRYDTETDGRHAKVTFTRLWYEDLARRDLTINAMSMTFDGVLDDPYGGQKDLQAGVVQFVGDPVLRIQEDYLRILRFFRFAGRFAKQVDGMIKYDQKQMEAIRKHAHGLSQVSRERVWQEVSKMMSHPSAPSVYAAMASVDVLMFADLPEPSEKRLMRMATAVKFTKTPAAVFSTLMKSTEQIDKVAKALKISTDDTKLMKSVFEVNDGQQHDLMTALQAMVVLQGRPTSHVVEAAKVVGQPSVAAFMESWVMPVFPLNGDVLKQHGMVPGKAMGRALLVTKQFWFANTYNVAFDFLLAKALEAGKEA